MLAAGLSPLSWLKTSSVNDHSDNPVACSTHEMLNPKQYLGSYRLQAQDESLPSLYPKILAELVSCSTCILVHAAAGKNEPFPEAIKHQVWGRYMQEWIIMDSLMGCGRAGSAQITLQLKRLSSWEQHMCLSQFSMQWTGLLCPLFTVLRLKSLFIICTQEQLAKVWMDTLKKVEIKLSGYF